MPANTAPIWVVTPNIKIGAAVLTANTANPYRVVAQTDNTSATNCAVRFANNMTATHLAQMPLGTAWISTTHNGSAWAEVNTRRYYIGLHVSEIDDGSGSGGGGGSRAILPAGLGYMG